MPRFRALSMGDPAPWFRQRTPSNPLFVFDTVAGRYIVLCFFASASDAAARDAIERIRASTVYDDVHASCFGVSLDPADEKEARVAERTPGFRVFWDFDSAASEAYGARAVDDKNAMRRLWVVLDPMLRVLRIAPFESASADDIAAFVAAQPPSTERGTPAPVLYLPGVFEPEICATLIGKYRDHGGAESGFMREREGKTVMEIDHRHKRRRDCIIEDEALRATLQERVRRRIVPEIAKAFQFHVTRMERYLVGCYRAEDSGHFRAHRDNTTKGTAHRRFAVSVNLNDDYDGGLLSFPEFASPPFKPPAGGAVVFSCSLLHTASPVTRGERFAFLPFLYDDAAAELRERNNEFLGEGVGAYRKS